MTRAKDISKIVTDADLSGTLDVAGAVTADGLTVEGSVGNSSLEASGAELRFTRSGLNNINCTGASGRLETYTGGSVLRHKIDSNGDISFYEDTGTTPKLFWDASEEALGLGTSSPNSLLDIKGSTGNSVITLNSANTIETYPSIGKLRFYSNDNSTNSSGEVGSIETIGIGTWNGAENNAAMTFNLIQGLAGTTSPVEAMRIDSSGDVLVKTIDARIGSDVGAVEYGTSTANSVRFYSSDTERMRIDGSGNVFVGKTSTSTNVVGIILGDSGYGAFCRDGNKVAIFNRKTNDGQIIDFQKDGTNVGRIGVRSGAYIYIGSDSVQETYIGFNNNYVYPADNNGVFKDNAIDLGNASARFDDIYATNGTIQTSDRNEKQDIEELSDAEQRVAVVAKGLMRKFRWRDAVAEKGENARTHFGIIAQDLQDAFTAEGLDAGDYAMFMSNTWWELDGETYETEEEAPEGATEKTRLGVRYNELLAFIISAI